MDDRTNHLSFEEASTLRERAEQLRDSELMPYLQSHPEIQYILSDMVSDCLVYRPTDIFAHVASHFGANVELSIEERLGLDGTEEEQAQIAKMQAMQRGKAARKEMSEQQDAATKMQAVQRGKQDRKVVAGKRIEADIGLDGTDEAQIAKMHAM